MVFEITRFYCQLDMTSSRFHRQGAPHFILHEGFWKSDHDFLIAYHSNFLSAMHGFRDNEVLLLTGYGVIVKSSAWGLCTHILMTDDGFWKSDHNFLIAFNSNFFNWDAWFLRLSGFISSRMWRHHDCRFWNGDPDFILVLHCNYTSIVHHFRFN